MKVDVGVVCLRLGPVAERRGVARKLAAELIQRADKLMYDAKGQQVGARPLHRRARAATAPRRNGVRDGASDGAPRAAIRVETRRRGCSSSSGVLHLKGFTSPAMVGVAQR